MPGHMGATGRRGPVGSPGVAGAQGERGPMGPTGSADQQGIPGPRGPQGQSGPTGETGSNYDVQSRPIKNLPLCFCLFLPIIN